jgi:hypothetical protein
MSKKSFAGGLNSLLESTITEDVQEESQLESVEGAPKKRGRPKSSFKEIAKTSQEGTREGEIRATFIVKEELLEKVKAVAYWDRMQMKEVIDRALEIYFGKKGESFMEQALQAYRKKGPWR